MPPKSPSQKRGYKSMYTDQGELGGRLADTKYAWTDNFLGQFNIYVNGLRQDSIKTIDELQEEIKSQMPSEFEDFDFESAREPGANIHLVFITQRPYRRMNFNLSALTVKELEDLQKIFQLAFEMARPVTEFRDSAAVEAVKLGNETFERVYRRAPLTVIRRMTRPNNYTGIFSNFPNFFKPRSEKDSEIDLHGSGTDLAAQSKKESTQP